MIKKIIIFLISIVYFTLIFTSSSLAYEIKTESSVAKTREHKKENSWGEIDTSLTGTSFFVFSEINKEIINTYYFYKYEGKKCKNNNNFEIELIKKDILIVSEKIGDFIKLKNTNVVKYNTKLDMFKKNTLEDIQIIIDRVNSLKVRSGLCSSYDNFMALVEKEKQKQVEKEKEEEKPVRRSRHHRSSGSSNVTLPVISMVDNVGAVVNTHNPSFTFSSNKSGTINYSGSCSSDTTQAVSGNNLITMNTLNNGSYTDCVMSITDSDGKTSNTLQISSFTVNVDYDIVMGIPTLVNYSIGDTLLSITGACSANDTIVVKVDDNEILPGVTCSGDVYSISLTNALVNGDHAVAVKAINSSNDVSPYSQTLNVDIDANKPVVSNVVIKRGVTGRNYTVSYDYIDADGDVENNTNIIWKIDDIEVKNGLENNLDMVYEYVDKKISVSITPRDNRGLDGDAVEFDNNIIVKNSIGVWDVPATDVSRATKIVSVGGSGTECTEVSPCDIDYAFSHLVPGDVVFLRGGTYTTGSTYEYRWIGVDMSENASDSPHEKTYQSGTVDNPIIIESYPGEIAIFDGEQDTNTVNDLIDNGDGNKIHGWLLVLGDYYKIRKIEIKNMGGHGMVIEGSHNIIEGIKSHDNVLCGIKVVKNDDAPNPDLSATDNIIRNSYFYDNSDAGTWNGISYKNGNQGDGVNVYLAVDTKVYNNKSERNSDDGIDTFWAKNTEFAYNIALNNGIAEGNGNGIKFSGNENLDEGHIYVHHNVSANNTQFGFNYNPGKDIIFEYNTGRNNAVGLYDRGFSFPHPDNGGDSLTVNSNNIFRYNISDQLEMLEKDKRVGSVDNSWQAGLPNNDYVTYGSDTYTQEMLDAAQVDFLSNNPAEIEYFIPTENSQHGDKGAYSI